ncbi:MAG: hypothetical protein QXE31_02050 [Candidatus Woesearchaeota archaeon]
MEKKYVFMLFFIFAIFLFLVVDLKIGGSFFPIILNIINFSTHIIAIFFGIRAFNYFKINTHQGKVSFFITASIITWFIGEIIWQINENAVVSIADFFYMSGYFFMTIALFLGLNLVNSDFFKSKKNLVILLLSIGLISYLYFSIIPVNWSKGFSLLENLVTIGYVFADLFILIPCIALILSVWSGKYKQSWIFILIGVCLFIIGDSLYAINYNTYTKGSIVDLTWYYAYLFFALGLYCLRKTAKESIEFLKKNLKKSDVKK